MALRDIFAKVPRIKFYRIDESKEQLDEGDVISGKFGEERLKGFSPVEMRAILRVLQKAIEAADDHAESEPNRRDRAEYLHLAEDLEEMLREVRMGNRSQAYRTFRQLDSTGRDFLDDFMGNSAKTFYSYFKTSAPHKKPLRNKIEI